tara:strand:+ start:451 stop:1302 length:852 start_codon:yes stop_codon:yes gene_type:complete
MNNVVALSIDNMNLADAMGFSSSASSPTQNTLYRVTAKVIQEIEETTKKIVSSPVFKITRDEEEIYSRELSVRFFAERQRWEKWDSAANTTQRTVMALNLKSDLKDTLGTYNLNRGGYVKDWDALPEARKEFIRSIKRCKVMMGMVTLIDPFYEGGAPATGYDTEDDEIPFIMDVKNRDSLKYIEASTDKLTRKSILPIEHTINLTGEVKTMPNGNTFAVIHSSLGDHVGFSDGDNAMLQDFVDYVQGRNEYVLHKWDEMHVESLSSEDAAIINSIVDVQDFE